MRIRVTITKVDPNSKTAEKMAPEPMLNQAKAQEDRTGRMPRGKEEAGESRSTLKVQRLGVTELLYAVVFGLFFIVGFHR